MNLGEIKAILNRMPEQYRPDAQKVYFAESLFGEEAARRDIRFLFERAGDVDRYGDKVEYTSLKIIVDNRICLFFYRQSDTWEYDGWEAGPYEDNWRDLDLG